MRPARAPDWRNLGVMLRTVLLVNALALLALLARNRSWDTLLLDAMEMAARVEPALVDGVAKPGNTHVRLQACAIPKPDGSLHIGMDYQGNGPGYANDALRLPRLPYPPAAMRSGAQGVLVSGSTMRSWKPGSAEPQPTSVLVPVASWSAGRTSWRSMACASSVICCSGVAAFFTVTASTASASP